MDKLKLIDMEVESIILDVKYKATLVKTEGRFITVSFTDYNKDFRVLKFIKSSGLQPNTKKHKYKLIQ